MHSVGFSSVKAVDVFINLTPVLQAVKSSHGFFRMLPPS
jgi:hypothetical protein